MSLETKAKGLESDKHTKRPIITATNLFARAGEILTVVVRRYAMQWRVGGNGLLLALYGEVVFLLESDTAGSRRPCHYLEAPFKCGFL